MHVSALFKKQRARPLLYHEASDPERLLFCPCLFVLSTSGIVLRNPTDLSEILAGGRPLLSGQAALETRHDVLDFVERDELKSRQ